MLLNALWMAAIIYACELTILSIGFTLTYLTAKIPNFAHGTYAGIGIFTVWICDRIYNISPYYGFPFAFLFCGLFSVAMYVLIINVLSNLGAGAIVMTIATLAIQIFLQASLWAFSYWLRSITGRYTTGFLLKRTDFVLFDTPGIFYVSLGCSLIAIITLHWMLTRTRIGIAMRATSEDTELSAVLGINVNRIQIFAWFLTGGLAGLAGAMVPMWFASSAATAGGMQTSIMAGSLLGGFTNMYGAIIGGFSIGLLEILLTFQLQQIIGTWVGEYRPLIPMLVLVLVLIVEPNGLQGFYSRFAATKTGERFLKAIGRGE